MAELPNGKFRFPAWSKPIIMSVALAFLAWGAKDYLDKTRRLTILETNYSNIVTLLEKIDRKVDRLYPDVGPALNPNGGGR